MKRKICSGSCSHREPSDPVQYMLIFSIPIDSPSYEFDSAFTRSKMELHNAHKAKIDALEDLQKKSDLYSFICDDPEINPHDIAKEAHALAESARKYLEARKEWKKIMTVDCPYRRTPPGH